MVAPRYLLLLALSSISFAGCAASLQDFHYSVVNKSRAEYAWLTNTSFGERWDYGSDYACGYKSGYYDASTGKGCVLPAVPPPCYWSTKYQSCEGQKQIQDWYRGYQCGVAAAQGSGYPFFHNVPVGPQAPVVNKDGCGMCYAPPCCLCENTAAPAATAAGLPLMPGSPAATAMANNLPATDGERATAVPALEARAAAGSTGAVVAGLIGPTGSAYPDADPRNVRTASAERPSAVHPTMR